MNRELISRFELNVLTRMARIVLLLGLGFLLSPQAWAQQTIVTISSGAFGDPFNGPEYLAFDSQGNLFVSDTGNSRIRRIDRGSGVVTTVVGKGTAGDSGDGGSALNAQLNCPASLAFDGAGSLYIADPCSNRVRKVVPGADKLITGASDEIISTYAGNGTTVGCSYVDGVPANQTGVDGPAFLAIDQGGNLFVALQGGCIDIVRRVDATTGLITTTNYHGDTVTDSMAFDNAGDLLLAYYNGLDMFSPAPGQFLVGDESSSLALDTPPGLAGNFDPPGMVFDKLGNAYLANNPFFHTEIYKVLPGSDGLIGSSGTTFTYFAGTGTPGYSGDGGAPLAATLNNPLGLAVNAANNLFIADNGNNVIRAILNGTATPAGNSVAVNPLDQNGDSRSEVQVTFDSITTAGTTVAVTGQNAPALPANFELAGTGLTPLPVFYDIATSAKFAGNVMVCITLNPLPPGPSLLHFNQTTQQWDNVTQSVDAATGTVCGQVTSLSPFALVVPLQQNQAPTITSPNATAFQVGVHGSFTVTTTGTPTPTLTATGVLPNAVSFVDNGDGTGTLSGTPAVGTGGTYSIAFTAANGTSPDATQTFSLTVNQAPAITSANSATFAAGTAGSFTVTATGFPMASLTESGSLPGGVTFIDNHNGTGTLAGSPNASGTFPLTFAAGNGVGTAAAQSFTLNVTGASGPALSVTPTSIDFGQVARFHLASGKVTLQNTGSSSVTLHKVSLTLGANADWDDFFFLNLCPSSLGAGKSCAIYVFYFADDLATTNALLNVPNSATGSPQAISLRGTGVKK